MYPPTKFFKQPRLSCQYKIFALKLLLFKGPKNIKLSLQSSKSYRRLSKSHRQYSTPNCLKKGRPAVYHRGRKTMKTLPKIQLGTKRLWWQGTKLPTMLLLFATALHTSSTVLTCTEIHINDRKRLDLDASRGCY